MTNIGKVDIGGLEEDEFIQALKELKIWCEV